MLKVVRLPFDDILFDPEAAGEMLTACMRRQRKMRYAGACAADDELIVLFEEVPFQSDSRLVLAPLSNFDPEGIIAEISDRYEHEHTLRTSFRINRQTWALFEVEEE